MPGSTRPGTISGKTSGKRRPITAGSLNIRSAAFSLLCQMKTYWLLSVIERAGSTNPEKIIAALGGGQLPPCERQGHEDAGLRSQGDPGPQRDGVCAAREAAGVLHDPPYHWFRDCSWTGRAWPISASKILPWMDKELERVQRQEWLGTTGGGAYFFLPRTLMTRAVTIISAKRT